MNNTTHKTTSQELLLWNINSSMSLYEIIEWNAYLIKINQKPKSWCDGSPVERDDKIYLQSLAIELAKDLGLESK